MRTHWLVLCRSRINAVSNAQVRGDSYESGCLGRTGKALLWKGGMLTKRGRVWREVRASSGVFSIFSFMCVSALPEYMQVPCVLYLVASRPGKDVRSPETEVGTVVSCHVVLGIELRSLG